VLGGYGDLEPFAFIPQYVHSLFMIKKYITQGNDNQSVTSWSTNPETTQFVIILIKFDH